MGAVGSAAVAAAVWLTAVGLAGPAGVQAATQTEIVAIEEADVHESLNRFLEEKEANAVALVEDWERKSLASEASLREALQRSPWRLISTAATAFRSKRPDS